jgi:hypothetical protein
MRRASAGKWAGFRHGAMVSSWKNGFPLSAPSARRWCRLDQLDQAMPADVLRRAGASEGMQTRAQRNQRSVEQYKKTRGRCRPRGVLWRCRFKPASALLLYQERGMLFRMHRLDIRDFA